MQSMEAWIEKSFQREAKTPSGLASCVIFSMKTLWKGKTFALPEQWMLVS